MEAIEKVDLFSCFNKKLNSLQRFGYPNIFSSLKLKEVVDNHTEEYNLSDLVDLFISNNISNSKWRERNLLTYGYRHDFYNGNANFKSAPPIINICVNSLVNEVKSLKGLFIQIGSGQMNKFMEEPSFIKLENGNYVQLTGVPVFPKDSSKLGKDVFFQRFLLYSPHAGKLLYSIPFFKNIDETKLPKIVFEDIKKFPKRYAAIKYLLKRLTKLYSNCRFNYYLQKFCPKGNKPSRESFCNLRNVRR